MPLEVVHRIGDAHVELPEGFTVHPRVRPVLQRRHTMSREGNIDWAFGELLALGSLLMDGKLVRISGQDTRRGTFVQRHSVVIDRKTGEEYYPLRNLSKDQERFLPYDSALSEFAAVGFEYGYSVANPNAFVAWEAQFGDFVNGAQSIIDEFIASGEAKWGQTSDIALLLPHGLEGQGPDHSSGRIERFLTLCAEGSMTVAVPSEPANYFHLLRRHAFDGIQRPLVVFTPKSMLRNRAVVEPAVRLHRRPVPLGDRRPALPRVRRPGLRRAAGAAVQRQDLLRVGRGAGQARQRRHRDRPDRAALPGARPPAGRRPGALPERRGHALGPGGTGQPGRVAAHGARRCRRSCPGWSASGGSPGAGWPRRHRARPRCTRWSRRR